MTSEAALEATTRPLRLVIVGFMGAGKSTVGEALARALGWDFVDLDDEIARRRGRPVDEVLRSLGLARFREIESRVGRLILERERVAVATGGGWAAQPGHMESLGADALSVWLDVSAETAVARVAASERPRPLLDGPRPVERARDLLLRRRARYAMSDLRVDTEGRTPGEVVEEILSRPRIRALTVQGVERR